MAGRHHALTHRYEPTPTTGIFGRAIVANSVGHFITVCSAHPTRWAIKCGPSAVRRMDSAGYQIQHLASRFIYFT